MNVRITLCALLALTLVACGGAKAKEDTKAAEVAAPASNPSGPPAGAQELMQGSWAGTIYIPSIDTTTTITATIEGTMLKIRDVNGSEEGVKRDHDMALGTGPDGSSLTVDLEHTRDEGTVAELCAATVSQGALTLCCNLSPFDESSRPGDIQPCSSPGDYTISLTRP